MQQTKVYDEADLAGLEPKALLRLQHAGEWIAWSRDFERFVAAASTRDEAMAQAHAAGEERPVCEWIDPDLPRMTGSVK